MARRKSKNSQEFVWELKAPQVNHIFGIFRTLEEAHNVACKVYEPDSPINETKEYMPLHHYECSDEDGGEFYLIWDETLCGYYEEPAALSISRIKLGQVKEYKKVSA